MIKKRLTKDAKRYRGNRIGNRRNGLNAAGCLQSHDATDETNKRFHDCAIDHSALKAGLAGQGIECDVSRNQMQTPEELHVSMQIEGESPVGIISQFA